MKRQGQGGGSHPPKKGKRKIGEKKSERRKKSTKPVSIRPSSMWLFTISNGFFGVVKVALPLNRTDAD